MKLESNAGGGENFLSRQEGRRKRKAKSQSSFEDGSRFQFCRFPLSLSLFPFSGKIFFVRLAKKEGGKGRAKRMEGIGRNSPTRVFSSLRKERTKVLFWSQSPFPPCRFPHLKQYILEPGKCVGEENLYGMKNSFFSSYLEHHPSLVLSLPKKTALAPYVTHPLLSPHLLFPLKKKRVSTAKRQNSS